jgi:hypothetical protein
MPKAYLIGEAPDPDPKKNKKYYDFDSRPEKVGRYWTTQESAEHACEILDAMQISAPHPDGSGTYIHTGFKVEKQPSGLFFVFCEVPFMPHESKAETSATPN